MSEAVRSNPGPEAVAWHAVPADEVIGRLKTDPAKGLDAGAASQRLVQYGPNRLPEGKQRGPLDTVPRPAQQCPGFRFARRRLCEADGRPVARCCGHLGCGDPQRSARVHPGGQGGEGAGFDPQHAFRRGQDHTRRRDPPDPGRGTRPRRRRAARIGRSHPCRSSPRRREEPADRRSGADRRVGADRQDDRRRSGKGDSGRSGRHGFFRDARLVRAWDRSGRRHRERDRARTHQPADGRSERARHAAAAPDQEVRIRDHRGDRRGQRDRVRLWQMGPGHGFHCHLSGGRQHRRVGHPGRVACADHRHPGDRRAAHGPAQRHHPAAPGSRDAGLGVADLLRQDGNLDLDGNDGGVCRHCRLLPTKSLARATHPKAKC